MKNFTFGHVTRHTVILVAAGLSFIAMGVSIREYLIDGPRYESLIIARNVMSLDYWGDVFIVAGVLVCIFAHWPHMARAWGYTILTGMCTAWAAFYLLGTLFADRPIAANISQAAVWGLQGLIWWAISGLPDVAATRKARMPLWTGSRKND